MTGRALGRALRAWALLVAGVLASSGLAAAEGKPQAEGPSSDPCGCRKPRSTMAGTAQAVALGLGWLPDRTLVVASALVSDASAPRGAELVQALARQVAGRIGPMAQAHDQALDLAAARAAASRARALVWLRVEIARGALRLSADAYPVPRTVWARVRAPAPGPAAHAHAQGPLDAEVRTFFMPVEFAAPVVQRFRGADPGVVAEACGQLDQDGSPDLVTGSRSRIKTVKLRGGRVERVREARWADLLPVAPVPLRQPLALAAIVPAGPGGQHPSYLDVAITDRPRSLRFDAELNVIAELDGLAVPAGPATACTRLRRMMLDRALGRCRPSDPPPIPSDLGRGCDALSSAVVVDRAGRAQVATALRARSRLVVRLDARPDAVLGSVGAQLAVGDPDQDGRVDIASGLDVLEPKHDALWVRTLEPSGELRERYRLPVPTGVSALAMCPPDGPGRAAIALATGDEIWVVR